MKCSFRGGPATDGGVDDPGRRGLRKKKLVWLVLLALAVALGLWAASGGMEGAVGMIFSGQRGTNGAGKRARANDSGICKFTYRYINSFGACSYTYSVESTGETCIVQYEAEEYSEFGTLSRQVEPSLLTELDALCRECTVERWNGFNKYDRNVRDGTDFSLSIEYNDGGRLSAEGSNAFPDGYGDFCDKLRALMQPYADALTQEAIRQKIDRGVSGELTRYLINFIQKGQSGQDSYQFFVTASDVRENNVNIQVDSVSGEIFPEGEHRYSGRADDAALQFDRIKTLIEKYDLVQWDYYNKAAEDPGNCEWFQISLGFSSGDTISAMGTEHPPCYDAFREEFLTLMAEMTAELLLDAAD